MALARTKAEKRVVELSATLKPLKEKDFFRMLWEYEHYYDNKGLAYFLVMERCKEFQVIRYFYFKRNKKEYKFFEFCQIFLNKDHRIVMAKDRWMGVDAWKEYSDLSIKHWFNHKYDYTYLGGMDRIGWSGVIVRSVLPELKQRGFRTSTHNMNPYKICYALLHNNRIETLFKLKQYTLVHHLINNDYSFDEWKWQAIRVALRHGYHWDNRQEVSDWFDLLHQLNNLHLDTRNPHYICPTNLVEAHNYYGEILHRQYEKRAAEERKKREAEMIQKVLDYEPIFKQNRECFFGMVFTDGKISIQIIPTAQGIREEGKKMHHCVGGYYNRPNSLILSAKIDGKRIETIEVDLKSYVVVQSRGVCNKDTEYHNEILKLMEDNMGEIKRRYRQRKVA